MHTPQLKYNTALLLASDRCEGLTVPAACFQFILCWQGEMSLRLNGLSLSVKPGHLLACPPESVVESLTQSPNFRCYYLRIAAAYLQQLLPMADKDWELKPLLDEHPLFTLQSDEEEDLCEYYKILCWKSASSSLFHQEEMNALVTAFFYCVKSVTKRQMKRAPRSSSAKEYLFRDFVELLSSLHPKPRQLRYYAERLCVTPRYLSLACKECSGQTASQLIDLYVTKEIEYLLRHSAKSIKEICMELGFPNQSTFAKYVREHLGTSPKQYRKGMGDGSAA